jgi:prolactin regulatory element-binding protein
LSTCISNFNSNQSFSEGARRRKGKSKEQATKLITFDVESQAVTQTDFSPDGGFQKNVKATNDGSLLATGGADGKLRVWKYPGLEELYSVDAHQNEIDDLDITASGNRVSTVTYACSHQTVVFVDYYSFS